MNIDCLRDPLDRRTFVERCARYAFGLTVLPALAGRALAAEKAAAVENVARGSGFGKAKRVIFLELQGGLSHIDSFRPEDRRFERPWQSAEHERRLSGHRVPSGDGEDRRQDHGYPLHDR